MLRDEQECASCNDRQQSCDSKVLHLGLKQQGKYDGDGDDGGGAGNKENMWAWKVIEGKL